MLLFPLLLVSGFVAILVLIIFFTFRGIKRKLQALQQQLEQRFGSENIHLITEVNFFGQESLPRSQMRGQGILLLTGERLFFNRLVPTQEIDIALKNLTGVEMVPSFKGKSVFQPLLQVSFTNAQGEPDKMAWLMQQPDKWQRALTSIMTPPNTPIED